MFPEQILANSKRKMAEIDCRIVAVFAVALTLLSLGGVIFFRHHQDNNPKAEIHTSALSMDCPLCGCNGTDEFPDKLENINTTFVGEENHFHIDEACLQCICEAGTRCKPSKCSGGEDCGLFGISFSYWTLAGRPTLEGTKKLMDEDNDDVVGNAYFLCVNNPFCSRRAVTGYVDRFSRDCDGKDGINCYDYATLHVLGPPGCETEELPEPSAIRFYQCWYHLFHPDT